MTPLFILQSAPQVPYRYPLSPHNFTMKFSAVLVAVATAVVCLSNPVASESEAVHLRVHVSQDKGVCYLQCGSGQYCANGTNTCRKPAGKECFNPATGAFQNGCAAGFKCGNGKCIYA